MTLGTLIKNDFKQFADPVTGAEVTRLTDPKFLSHHMYFYNRMMTADGRYLLMASDRGAGRQLYLLDLTTGEARQLTSGEDVDDFSGVISADDRSVFYQQADTIWQVDLETLDRHKVFQAQPGWQAGNWGLSEDDRYLAVVSIKKDTLPATRKKGSWDFFAETCLAKPLSQILYVDTQIGESRCLVEDRCWFGHAQIRPGDPDTVMFCHEGPYDLIDARIWLVQSDGSNYRRVRSQPTDVILTHEFWLPDGSNLAYVYRETTGKKQEEIRLADPDTLQDEALMSCSPYAHFISDHQGKFFVGDAQGSEGPIHQLSQQAEVQSITESGELIYLINGQKKIEVPLAYHGTSWTATHGHPQDSHPHPFFTGDDQQVIFVSDREGLPAIYKVTIPEDYKKLL